MVIATTKQPNISFGWNAMLGLLCFIGQGHRISVGIFPCIMQRSILEIADYALDNIFTNSLFNAILLS